MDDGDHGAAVLSGRLARRAAYDVKVTGMGDGTWYWHLHLDGERVNGGLSSSPGEARAAARHAIGTHLSGEPLIVSCWRKAGSTKLL